MNLKRAIYNYIKNNKILEEYIHGLDLSDLDRLNHFDYYDLLDNEYLVNILVLRRNNFDENKVMYFHLIECINDLKDRVNSKVKWISIKFGDFYVVFILNEMQEVFTFFGFKPKV